MAVEGKVRWIDVTEDDAGQRIDNYLLARLKGVPKSHIYRIVRSGEVRINSKRVEASQKVAPGDRIRVPPVRVAERGEAQPAPHFKLPILFEDDFLVAIDKPAGLAVHGGSGIAHGVIESLRSMRPDNRRKRTPGISCGYLKGSEPPMRRSSLLITLVITYLIARLLQSRQATIN